MSLHDASVTHLDRAAKKTVAPINNGGRFGEKDVTKKLRIRTPEIGAGNHSKTDRWRANGDRRKDAARREKPSLPHTEVATGLGFPVLKARDSQIRGERKRRSRAPEIRSLMPMGGALLGGGLSQQFFVEDRILRHLATVVVRHRIRSYVEALSQRLWAK